MLTILTDEQRATLPGWRDKWLSHALRATPLIPSEWETVRRAAIEAARFTGLPEPVLVRSGSPMAATLLAPVLGALLSDAGWHVPSGQWLNGAADSDTEEVRTHADIMQDAVDAAIRISGAFSDSVREAIETGISIACNYWRSAWIGGSHWSATLGYLTWFRDIGKVEVSGDLWNRLSAIEGICLAGPSTWYKFDDEHLVVCISDHPVQFSLDAQQRAHHESGPAIRYRDGWTVSMWHGVNVPDDFWTWDITRALGERNIEIRRCAIERIGWDKLLDRLTLVAEAPDPGNFPHMLRLYEGYLINDLYDQPARLLVGVNGTPERDGSHSTFGMPVPADIDDPVDAAATLYNLPRAVYEKLERRT